MIHIECTFAAPLLLAAALLSADAAAQGRVVRLPERDRPLAGTPAQLFAIGRAEGAEHEMFGDIADVAFDAAENLYVLDRQTKRVMVYDRSGRFFRQIGKAGQGPGELIAPVQLEVSGDGTVIVLDMGRPGYALFGGDGAFRRNVMLADNWMPAFAAPMHWHSRGGVVGTFRQRPTRIRPGEQVQMNQATPLLFYPLAGGEPTQVFNVPVRERVSEASNAGPGGRQEMRRIIQSAAFTPSVMSGVLPSGQVALSFTTGYTVRIVDLNGQTLRYLQRPMRPRLTTQADRDRWIAVRRKQIRSGEGSLVITRGGGGGAAPAGPSEAQMRAGRERDLAQTEFADTIPALQGLRVAPSGKLWIERTAAVIGEPGPIDIVTPEGQYIGTIGQGRLPDAFSRGGLAATIEEDEDGVERVVVRRLPEGWR